MLPAFALRPAPSRPPIKIVYPAPSSTSWPIWLAKEGGYFAKHGLDATIEFALHPAGPAAVISGEALTHNLGLDTALLAAIKGEQVVIIASPLNVAQFVLVGSKSIKSAKDLVGKRIGVGRVGDPPYHYALALLDAMKVETKGLQWIGAGAPPQRALTVRNGLADAAMLTPPDYYALVDDGFTMLGRLQDHRQIAVGTSYMWRRKQAAESPQLVEAFLKAHVEAVKRFYDDKAFTLGVMKKYIKTDDKTLARLYDETVEGKVFERVPYVAAAAVAGVVERGKAETPELAKADFRKAIDQGPIDRLVAQGFFEQVFGAGIKAEVEAKRAGALR